MSGRGPEDDDEEDDEDFVPVNSDDEKKTANKSKSAKQIRSGRKSFQMDVELSDDDDEERKVHTIDTTEHNSEEVLDEPAEEEVVKSESGVPDLQKQASKQSLWDNMMQGGKKTAQKPSESSSTKRSIDAILTGGVQSRKKQSKPSASINIDSMFSSYGVTQTSESTQTSATDSNQSASKSGHVAPKAQSNLQKLLASINGPKKTTTMNKSKDDWSNFKETKLVTEEVDKLNANRKNGKVDQVDFLARTGQRQEEIMREMRRASNPRARKPV